MFKINKKNQKKIKKLKKKLAIVLQLLAQMYETVENLIYSTNETELMQRFIIDFNEISRELEIKNKDLIKICIKIYWS